MRSRTSCGVAIASLLLLGCTDALTSVRLEIVTAPQLVVDGLAITMNDTRRTDEMRESLQLLVPDRWAGSAQRIEVEGTRSGATIAVGAVMVTPIAGEEVAASVTLVDASCDLVCDIGTRRCASDGVVTCELGVDACPQWSAAIACPSSTPHCSNGSCSDTCVDECVAGAEVCDGTSSVRSCGQADTDSCLDWTAPASCPMNQVCANDTCTQAFALSITKTGNGYGTVTSVPTGIVCGAACSMVVAALTDVTLTATPNAGTTFGGWTGGGCAGVGTCVIPVNAATTVTATFSASPAPEVIAGFGKTCWLKPSGAVLCWTKTSSSQLSGAFIDYDISDTHECGVLANGSVTCSGVDDFGQASPPAGNFIAVDAGAHHTCAIKSDRTVTCWGRNDAQQSNAPTGTFSMISAGVSFTCGIRSTTGAMACWGVVPSGQPSGTFVQVSAGSGYACAVKSNGNVVCWGSNQHNKSTAPAGTFTQVSANHYHTCAITTGGAVVCWGLDNSWGSASPPAGTFSQVGAGYDHSCGIKSDGSIDCWGNMTDPP